MDPIIIALQKLLKPFTEILVDVAQRFIGKSIDLLIEYAEELMSRIKAQLRVA